jgi:hypothetical protein
MIIAFVGYSPQSLALNGSTRVKPIIHPIVYVCQATRFSRFDFLTKQEPVFYFFLNRFVEASLCVLRAVTGGRQFSEYLEKEETG